MGGEVGGFKQLHVETKQLQQSFMDSLYSQDVKTEPEMCFRAEFQQHDAPKPAQLYGITSDLNFDYKWGKICECAMQICSQKINTMWEL